MTSSSTPSFEPRKSLGSWNALPYLNSGSNIGREPDYKPELQFPLEVFEGDCETSMFLTITAHYVRRKLCGMVFTDKQCQQSNNVNKLTEFLRTKF